MLTRGLILLIGILIGVFLGYILFKKWKTHLQPSAPNKLPAPSFNNMSEKLSQNLITRGEVSNQYNLMDQKTELNVQEVLALLNEYQTNQSPELFEKLHKELEINHETDHNVLHDYLHQQHVELEKVEEMVEINHELLTEEDHEGNTALHHAEQHQHHEVAEWMTEHERFKSEHEREHFLSHHNHQGHTALHDAVHLWHYHPHTEHFFHMVEAHPIGSLLWKDSHGKTVYEHFFENPHNSAHKLLEALEHKGVIHKEGDRYELSAEAEKFLHENHADNLQEVSSLKLLVQDYKPIHHPHNVAEKSVETKDNRPLFKKDHPHLH